MAVVTVKTTSITNQDASPRVAQQAGIGGGARIKRYDDFVTVTNGDSIASKYVMVRIPSTARVKRVFVENVAIAGAIADIGVYYASSVNDISAGQTAGAVISAAFFGSAVALTAAAQGTDVTNESGTYTIDKRNLPIWQALGFTADPGGKFDIVLTLTAAATATGLAALFVDTIEF
jgi:hypothetical protein